MKTLLIAALTLSALPALGMRTENTTTDNPTGCPVLIQGFGHSPVNYPFGNFQVKYKNQSDKDIVGINFSVETMNSVGDFAPTLHGVDYGGVVKPTKGTTLHTDMYEYRNGFYLNIHGERIHVTKVAFADGTTWSDDGSKQCRLFYDERKGVQ